MTIEQTDARHFKGTTAEILAFAPTNFDGWTYAESTTDHTGFRWNVTTKAWETVTPNPFSLALYVDGGTATLVSDQNGSVGRPFSTIAAAVAAMTDNTAILVMPGTYPENIVWRDLENTALVGVDASSVVISPAVGDAFSWTPAVAAVIQTFTIESLTFKPQSGRSLVLDGANTGSFLKQGARIRGVVFSNASATTDISMNIINSAFLFECTNTSGGDVEVFNSASVIFLNAVFPASKLTVSWDGLKPKPSNGRRNVALGGTSVFRDIVMDKSPWVLILANSLVINSITDTGLVFDAGSGGPILMCFGSIGFFGGGGGVTLAYPDAPPGTARLMFTQADLSGPIKLSVPGQTRLPVDMRGVVFRQTGPATVNIGDFLDMDARGSSYLSQGIFAVSGGPDQGTLDRDTWNIYGVPDFAVPTSIPISPSFPGGTTQYTVTPNTTNPVAVAIVPGGKAFDQFTAVPAAATGVTDFGIVRAQAT